MGGFIFGYDTGQISGFLVSIRKRTSLTEEYNYPVVTDILLLYREWQNFRAVLDRTMLMAKVITSATSARVLLLLW